MSQNHEKENLFESYWHWNRCSLLTLLFLTVGFWRTLRAQTMTVLQDTVTVIAAKATRTDDIIEFIEETAEASNHRLRFTWIGHDGRVLYETDYSAAQMENHAIVRKLCEPLRK